MSILAQLLGFIEFFSFNFFNVASMFLSVIGAIQISDDDDDDVKTHSCLVALMLKLESP